MADNIIQQKVSDGYIEEMVRYAIADNIHRMIPLVDDSFKPVQRRIVYSMYELSATSLAKKKKSARIVGDTMGKYHPHGDSSIYGAMDTIMHWWECKLPLLTGYGNWGNLLGDGPAAMRYTEAYLSKECMDICVNIMKEAPEVVDMMPNFSGDLFEPDTLPMLIPLLLINGASGVGVGMTINVPPHNPRDVINEVRKKLKDPSHEIVLIPDFCTPCDILHADWKQISRTGSGKFLARGRIESGTMRGKEKHETPALFITSLPHKVMANPIRQKIIDLQARGILKDLINVYQDGDQNNVKIAVQFKNGVDLEYAKSCIFKYTDVQASYTVNFEAIKGLEPLRFSYTSYIENYIMVSKTLIRRLYSNKLQKEMTRYHVIDAYIKVLKSGEIDKIIKTIRGMKTREETDKLAEYFQHKLGITFLQAKFIIDSRLRNISRGALAEYEAEAASLESTISVYEPIIVDDAACTKVLDDLLCEFDQQYGKQRTCKVLSKNEISDIPQGTFKIVITENNYIRKIGENDNIGVVKGDQPNYIIKVENDQNILVFANTGKVFKIPVHKISLCDSKNPGTDLRQMCKGLTSDIVSVLYEPDVQAACKSGTKYYMVILSSMNTIKRVELDDFLTIMPSGLMFTKLNPNDIVVGIEIIPDSTELVIYSGHKALRIASKDISVYRRNAVGVAAMNSKELISGCDAIMKDVSHMVVITQSGMVNKFDIAGLDKGKRAGAGSSVIKLKSNDSILRIIGCNDNNKLRLITSEGTKVINVSDIPVGSSISPGTKYTGKTEVLIKAKLI